MLAYQRSNWKNVRKNMDIKQPCHDTSNNTHPDLRIDRGVPVGMYFSK